MSDVKELKTQIEELEAEIKEEEGIVNQLEGKLDTFKERLKKDFGCVTVQEAEKQIQKFNDEIAKLQEEKKEAEAELDKLLEGKE